MPLIEILDGVLEASVAFPPEMENVKSSFTSATFAALLEKEASFIVTAIVALVAAKDTDEIVGATLSYVQLN